MLPPIYKIAMAIGGILLLAAAACLTGLSFYLWPTQFADHPLEMTPRVLSQLAALKDERKFLEDRQSFYFGAPNEAVRAKAQAAVDAVIDALQSELPSHPRRSVVLGIFKTALAHVDLVDTEERDQFLVYLERAMRIVGVSSSGELFNVWRYGVPCGWISQCGRA